MNQKGLKQPWIIMIQFGQTTLDVKIHPLTTLVIILFGENQVWYESTVVSNHTKTNVVLKVLTNIFLSLILPFFSLDQRDGHGYAPLIHKNTYLIFFFCPKEQSNVFVEKSHCQRKCLKHAGSFVGLKRPGLVILTATQVW